MKQQQMDIVLQKAIEYNTIYNKYYNQQNSIHPKLDAMKIYEHCINELKSLSPEEYEIMFSNDESKYNEFLFGLIFTCFIDHSATKLSGWDIGRKFIDRFDSKYNHKFQVYEYTYINEKFVKESEPIVKWFFEHHSKEPLKGHNRPYETLYGSKRKLNFVVGNWNPFNQIFLLKFLLNGVLNVYKNNMDSSTWSFVKNLFFVNDFSTSEYDLIDFSFIDKKNIDLIIQIKNNNHGI